jgi:hypothetical protein
MNSFTTIIVVLALTLLPTVIAFVVSGPSTPESEPEFDYR